jgi:ribosomal protein S18 acetylase RimI-like enzyme
VAFVNNELSTFNDLTWNELSHLECLINKEAEKQLTLTTIVGIYNKQNENIGFCLLPCYSKNIVTSLYIGRQHRNQGFASWILNELKIDTLNCLTDNLNAIRLYKKLGFRETSTSYYSIRFERFKMMDPHITQVLANLEEAFAQTTPRHLDAG